MSIRRYKDINPIIAKTAYIDEAAVVIGKTTIGEDSSVWPTTVIRGDVHQITIGERTNIQDGSILHVTHDSNYITGGFSLTIGNDVTVGHRAVLHGCVVQSTSLIGMGAIVLDGAIVESNVILGAGSLVSPGKIITSGGLWVGAPAKKIRDLSESEIQFLTYSANHYVKLKNDYL